MSTIKRFGQAITLVAALLALAGSVCFCAPGEYLKHVGNAVGLLEQGKTNECNASLKEALECNSGDPLAHAALGLSLLMGGKADSALDEFDLALEQDGKCAQAAYGKGMVYLSKNNLTQAKSCFGNAVSMNPELPVRGAIEYINAIESGTYKLDFVTSEDESLQSMSALALMSSNRHSEAFDILSKLAQKASGDVFGERIGCTMTFLHSAPVQLTGWPIKETKAKSGKKDNMPKVSKTVTLKADLRKASNCSLVSFFVDGKLVGLTNNPPFSYSWDTTRIPNGTHWIKIVGSDSYGTNLSEKTMQVVVHNDVSGGTDPVSGTSVDALWTRLWKLMQIKPSRAGINYNLAICSIRLKDDTNAIAALERVIAANPSYLDASELIANLNASNGNSAKLYGVKTNRKLIALTFDDGPKSDSGKLLDLLKEKNVGATFFVVGKQVKANPEIAKRMAAEGHDIQNHTYNHRALEFLSAKETEQEIAAGSAIVREITGKSPRFVRPPGARAGKKLPEIVKNMGMTAVYWTANCVSCEGTTKEKMTKFVVSSTRPGGIILMHNCEGVTLQALPGIIDSLRSKGYTFVTLSELTAI
jgi:peptidoglycan/xylan/chitin deacetylase (PgdA/CDA1 family)